MHIELRPSYIDKYAIELLLLLILFYTYFYYTYYVFRKLYTIYKRAIGKHRPAACKNTLNTPTNPPLRHQTQTNIQLTRRTHTQMNQ